MPFKSKAQMRFMFANHPKIAMEFAAKTKDMKKLPEKKKSSSQKKFNAGAYASAMKKHFGMK